MAKKIQKQTLSFPLLERGYNNKSSQFNCESNRSKFESQQFLKKNPTTITSNFMRFNFLCACWEEKTNLRNITYVLIGPPSLIHQSPQQKKSRNFTSLNGYKFSF